MYTIDIHHKGDKAPTTYTIFNKKEAEQKTKDYWEAGDFLADKPEECLFEIVRVDDEDANEKA